MKGWMDDLAYAARRLMRSPGFSLTALTILILGIGVNSTAFSVVNSLLLQPPPFTSPDRIVIVLQDSDGGAPSSTSYPAYQDMIASDVFESVSSFYSSPAFLDQDGALAPVLVEYATASYMHVIGLSPGRGAWFGTEHDDPAGPAAAVITHRMWTDRLAADPDVIGQTIRVNGGAATVIGVGPAEFNGGSGPASVDLWLSVSAMRATGGRAASLTRRQDHPFIVRARLADGATFERAVGAMNLLADDLERIYPELNTNRGITVISALDNRISPSADAQIVPAAAFAMGVVILVLIIGTLNLANLLLVRSTARAREIAVRLALGSGRARVVRVVMAEAVLLAGLGGAGGLALAWVAASAARNARFDFGLPLLLDLRLDGRVVGFTVLMSIATGCIFGLVPALRATRRDVNATLRDDATAGLGSRRRVTLTGALVAGQVAVSLLLLSLAGIFVESLTRAQGADPGFDWENTAYVQVNATPLDLESEATVLLFQRIEERIEALPGVVVATTALMLPAAQLGTTTLLVGAQVSGIDRPAEVPWNYVSPDFFDVVGVPLLYGRLLEESDLDGPDATVVSEAFARTYFGRSDVVGETYRNEGSPEKLRPIVGVVADATVRSLGEAPTPSVYFPLNFAFARMNFLFRVDGSASDAIAAVRSAIQEEDQRIMILGASTMSDHLGDTLERERLAAGLLAGLGGMALILAMLGIYGVVSFSVSRRKQEVGIRIALGAGSESVIRLFVRDVSAVVVFGSAIGAALSIPAGRLAGQFTGAGASVLGTGGVAALLLLTSLVATVIPALRATRTNPTDALRRE
jgi:putative ABC transport system permease protein